MPYAKSYINLQEHEAERRRKLKQRASAVSDSKRSKGRQLSKAEFRSEFRKLPKEVREELRRLGCDPFEDNSNKIIRRQTNGSCLKVVER